MHVAIRELIGSGAFKWSKITKNEKNTIHYIIALFAPCPTSFHWTDQPDFGNKSSGYIGPVPYQRSRAFGQTHARIGGFTGRRDQ